MLVDFRKEKENKGGYSGFKSQRWSNGGKNQNLEKYLGLPTKPRKIPGPNITFFAKLPHSRTGTSVPRIEYPLPLPPPKKSLLKSSHLKKILAKFSYPPKKSMNRKIKPKKSLRSSTSLEIRSTPPPPPPSPLGSVYRILLFQHHPTSPKKAFERIMLNETGITWWNINTGLYACCHGV